jgi:hypothetical protein
MLGQLVLDSPHVLSEAAGDVVDGAENIFGVAWQAVKQAAVWCVAVVGLLLFLAILVFYARTSPRNDDDSRLSGYTRLSDTTDSEKEEEEEKKDDDDDEEEGE